MVALGVPPDEVAHREVRAAVADVDAAVLPRRAG